MGRLTFSEQGTLVGVDGGWETPKMGEQLQTSSSLRFLRSEEVPKDTSPWALYQNGKKLEPLRFSNGKTQADVVEEIVGLIKGGKRVIFLQGVCGTGKSAIALHLARALGRASIVVPVKGLQRQYEEDYTFQKYVVKPNGQKMKIAMITGRENHDSVIQPGISCADPLLPDTIAFSERNWDKILLYYQKNPFIHSSLLPHLHKIRRISIAPANPYWSPIRSAEYELTQLTDARKKKYKGVSGQDYIFYHRQEGCSYYDQYQAYIDADVLIFNSAKYLIEMALGRKPVTAVDVIDEADAFLDALATQESLNLTRLGASLQHVASEFSEVDEIVSNLLEVLHLEEQQKAALGVDESKVFPLLETHVGKILGLLIKSSALQAEIALDEMHYANHAIGVAAMFEDLFAKTYVSYSRKEEGLVAHLTTIDLSSRFAELQGKTQALVLMSGTLHNQEVLERIFSIRDVAFVDAETQPQGSLEIQRTGKEFDCKYASFQSGKHTRSEYLEALEASIAQAKRPVLVHVHAFEDLPTEEEKNRLELQHTMSREHLRELQKHDKTGKLLSLFKAKLQDVLFTTKGARGVDFPGDLCNSVVFTKYPHAYAKDIFWVVLKELHPENFWSFYKDHARRGFLQRVYRALRSKEDHVYVLSPDSRVLDAAWQLAKEMQASAPPS